MIYFFSPTRWFQKLKAKILIKGDKSNTKRYQQQSKVSFILIIWAYMYVPQGDASQKTKSVLLNRNR